MKKSNLLTYVYVSAFIFLLYKYICVHIYTHAHIYKDLLYAGVAQWIERRLVNQRVTGLILSQGTCLGCRPGPQVGVRERQSPIDVSLSLFLLPFFLSKNK